MGCFVGHVSMRYPTGTPFINAVVETVNQLACKRHVLDLLMIVSTYRFALCVGS